MNNFPVVPFGWSIGRIALIQADTMTKTPRWVDATYHRLLSEHTKEWAERVIVYIAIASFLIHLGLIFLYNAGILPAEGFDKLLKSPIAAIYTPFSFILVYEVYLLVYYLPYSITTYIGKQYEIISLIIIRRLFKDLGNLELTEDWFNVQYDLQFTYDLLASILLFILLFFFYRLDKNRPPSQSTADEEDVERFILLKKLVAIVLVPLLFLLAVYSLGHWIWDNFFTTGDPLEPITDINDIFFGEFFTVLILVDVLLLLFSFVHTGQYHKVIRNSGFIISTILLRLSFGVDGLLNFILILTAVLFGVIILALHNQYERYLVGEEQT
jgi:hypothetical protein